MAEVPDTPLSYPVVLDLRDRLVVIVGPGELAQRRARSFLRTGADVAVISPDPTTELMQAEQDGLLTLERRPYVRGDLDGASVVVCVSDSDEVARAVSEEARSRGCLAHIRGAPELSSYSIPVTLRRGPLVIAVSTGGTVPSVAKEVRSRLAEEFGEEWAEYLVLLGHVRQMAETRCPGSGHEVIGAILVSDVLERLRSGAQLTAEAIYVEFATVEQGGGNGAPEAGLKMPQTSIDAEDGVVEESGPESESRV